MSNEISEAAQTAPYSPTLEIVTPLSTRMLFWRARFLTNSTFLHHLPFMFWLIEVCRPKSYVELGVGDGVSYFAACQAFDKLDSDAHCHGIDTWPEAENGRIPDAVQDYNADNYGEFSRLSRADPREAVRGFPDGSIDLLHVDMELDQSLLDSLTHDWTRKLSRSGVVLLHGIHTRFSEGPARAFLERICSTYPTVTLEGGDGLMLVLYGPERQARLTKLAGLSLGMPGYTEVHRVFARLGATHHFEWASRSESSQAVTARKKQEAAEKALKDSESSRVDLEKKLAARDAAYDERSEQIAGLQARLFDLQEAHDARGVELEGLRATIEQEMHAAVEKERSAHVEALAARDKALAKIRQELEEKTAALAVETEKREAHFRELIPLTSMLEQREQRVQDLERELEVIRAHRDALLDSTFWKLSAPVRKTIDKVRAIRG